MINTTLNFNIRQETNGRKVVVEMDIDKFEKLAADLGFFQPEFLKSVDRAEREIVQKKTKRLRGLKDLWNLWA